MRIPWLRKAPPNWRRIGGKQIYQRSGSPPKAQVVIDGNPKAEIRPIVEPFFTSERYPAAGATRVDFYTTRINQVTPNGLTLDTTLSNVQQPNTLGEPEIFDFVGLAVVYEMGMPAQEINRLVDGSAFTFQFGTQQVFVIPSNEFPGATGLAGVGDLFEERSIQVGAAYSSNFYDVTVNGFPRRIWSQESFSLFATYRAGIVLPVARRIMTKMKGVHYIR
jgi:hypothetical protein